MSIIDTFLRIFSFLQGLATCTWTFTYCMYTMFTRIRWLYSVQQARVCFSSTRCMWSKMQALVTGYFLGLPANGYSYATRSSPQKNAVKRWNHVYFSICIWIKQINLRWCELLQVCQLSFVSAKCICIYLNSLFTCACSHCLRCAQI